jgi:hypothetical protein
VALAAPRGTGGKKKKKDDAPNVGEIVGGVIADVGSTVSSIGSAVGSQTQAIDRVEKDSYNLLPTSLVLDVAGLGLEERDSARAARRMARDYDVPPAYIFGTNDPKEYVNPVTGGRLTIQDANRFTDYFAPAAIASMLSAYTSEQAVPGKVERRQGASRVGAQPVADIDPGKVADHARTLSKQFPNLGLQEGIALSAALVRRGISPKNFSGNVDILRTFLETTGERADAATLVAMATQIGSKRLRDMNDVAATLAFGEEGKRLIDIARNREEDLRRLFEERRTTEYTGPGSQARTDAAITEDIQDIYYTEDLRGLAVLAPDLAGEIAQIEKDIRLEEESFQNNLLVKTLAPIGTALNEGMLAIEKAGTVVAAPVAGLLVGAIETIPGIDSLSGPDGAGFMDGWNASFRTRDELLKDLGKGQHWGTSLATRTALPDWMGMPLDIGIGFIVDPFIIVGKGITSLRSLRVAPEILEKGSLYRTLGRKFAPEAFGPTGRFARANERLFFRDGVTGRITYGTRAQAYTRNLLGWATRKPGKLFGRHNGYTVGRAAMKGDTELLDELAKMGTRWDVRGPVALDEPYVLAAAKRMREKYGTGTWSDTVQEEWAEVMMAHFGIKPRPNSVAAEAFGVRATTEADGVNAFLARTEDFRGRTYNETDSGLLIPNANANDLVGDVAARMAGGEIDILPLRFEVPHTRLPFGFRRIGNAMATSKTFGDTGFGRRVIAAGNINPGNRFKLFEAPERYVRLRARRWRTLDVDEVANFETRIALARKSATPEQSLQDIVEEMDKLAIERIAAKEGFPVALLPDLMNELKGTQATVNRQVFGALPAERGFRRIPGGTDSPLLESQLVNEVWLVDPVHVRQLVNRYTGAIRELRDGMVKVLGKNPQNITEVNRLKDLKDVALFESLDVTREAWRTIVRGWKFSVVPRPGYIGRVILVDENARFLGTTGSLFERLAATNLEDATAALARGFVSVPGVATLPRGVAGAAGRGVDALAGRMLDELWPDHVHVLPDGTELRIGNAGRPGRLPPEAAARSVWRETELAEDMINTANQHTKNLRAVDGSWQVIKPGQAGYYEAWQHALNNQLGLSEFGKAALRAVKDGKGIKDTAADVLAAARKNPIVYQRIGVAKEEITDWAEDVAKLTHAYTLGSREIATLALNRTDNLGQYLQTIKPDTLPPVHGPLLEKATGGTKNWLRRYVDYWYDVYVRSPEDYVNRLPYYNVWKDRAERAIIGNYTRQGLLNGRPVQAKLWGRPADFGPMEQLERAIASDADDYFYHQTRAGVDELQSTGVEARPPTEGRRWETAKLPPERNLEPRVYLSTDPDFTNFLTAADFQGPMLRVKKSAVKTEQGAFAVGAGDDAIPVEFFSTSNIPASKWEFFGVDGKWHPLKDANKSVLVDMTPKFKESAHLASREFALAQVKKIMFDFSEQNRVGEMIGSVFPFIQPFQEAFVSWGHILTQKNPAMIGYANQLFRAGMQSGFLQRDEETGELVVPTSWWMGQSLIMRLMSDSRLFGDSRAIKGLKTVTPLNAFNQWMNSTITPPADIPIVGGLPLPVPSLPPWIGFPAKKFFENQKNSTLGAYLFQYGPSTPIGPAWLDKEFRALLDLDDGQMASMDKAVFRAFEAEGTIEQLRREGKNQQEIEDIVHSTARNLMFARGFMGAYQLGSTQLRYGWTEKQKELQAAIEADPVNGMDKWLDENPGHESLAVGTLVFMGGVVDPATGKPVIDPDTGEPYTGVRIPYSKFAVRFLEHPRIRELSAEFPAFVGALILDSDPEVAEKFDFGALSELVAKGWYDTKPLDRFGAEVEAGGFWEAVEHFYSGAGQRVPTQGRQLVNTIEQDYILWDYDTREKALIEKFGEDSEAVRDLKREEDAFLTELRAQFPEQADRLIEYKRAPGEDGLPGEIIEANWRTSRNAAGMPHPAVEQRLRAFASVPELQGFTAVQGLKLYFDGRDKIAQDMADLAISGIYDNAAQEEGLTKRYEDLVARIEEQYPNAMVLVEKFLDRDLGDIPSTADTKLSTMKAKNPERYETYLSFDTDYQKLRNRMDAAEGDAIFDLLDEQRALFDSYSLDKSKAWVVPLWYDAHGYTERVDHEKSLQTRDPATYSVYDWKLMGVDVSKRTVERLNQIREWTSYIFDQEEQSVLEGRDYSVSENMSRMNAFIRDNWIKKDPKFARVVDNINTWGWTFEAAGLTTQGGSTGRAWKDIVKLANDFRLAAEKNEWTGTFDSETVFVQSRTYIRGVIDEYQKKNPVFKRQWQELDQQMFTGSLFEYFVPETWYGGIGVT